MDKSNTVLEVSYNLPSSKTRESKVLTKDDSKEYKEELRKLEDYLAEHRAEDIVYNVITEE